MISPGFPAAAIAAEYTFQVLAGGTFWRVSPLRPYVYPFFSIMVLMKTQLPGTKHKGKSVIFRKNVTVRATFIKWILMHILARFRAPLGGELNLFSTRGAS